MPIKLIVLIEEHPTGIRLSGGAAQVGEAPPTPHEKKVVEMLMQILTKAHGDAGPDSNFTSLLIDRPGPTEKG